MKTINKTLSIAILGALFTQPAYAKITLLQVNNNDLTPSIQDWTGQVSQSFDSRGDFFDLYSFTLADTSALYFSTDLTGKTFSPFKLGLFDSNSFNKPISELVSSDFTNDNLVQFTDFKIFDTSTSDTAGNIGEDIQNNLLGQLSVGNNLTDYCVTLPGGEYLLSLSGQTKKGSEYTLSTPTVYAGLEDCCSDPVSVVPEPSTYALMLGGLGLVGFMANRRRKTNS